MWRGKNFAVGDLRRHLSAIFGEKNFPLLINLSISSDNFQLFRSLSLTFEQGLCFLFAAKIFGYTVLFVTTRCLRTGFFRKLWSLTHFQFQLRFIGCLSNKYWVSKIWKVILVHLLVYSWFFQTSLDCSMLLFSFSELSVSSNGT